MLQIVNPSGVGQNPGVYQGYPEPQRGSIFVTNKPSQGYPEPRRGSTQQTRSIICTITIANVDPPWGLENSTSQSVFTNIKPLLNCSESLRGSTRQTNSHNLYNYHCEC